jgi:hypothetical protein
MRLVIEIEGVADELLQLDLGRAFESAIAAGTAAALAAISSVASLSALAAISTGAIATRPAITTAASATFSRGAALLALFLLLCHV